MPKKNKLSVRLQPPGSLSPLSSPGSSLPSVYSPRSVHPIPARGKKAQSRKKPHEKPKLRQNNCKEENDDRNSFDTTKLFSDTMDQDTDQAREPNGDESSAWPVLVAVRCRPRKRQRAVGRFATVIGADEEIRRSDRLNSSDSSSVSSISDDKGNSYRSSSSSVHRGVFEYSACRDYDNAAAYDANIPPPRMQRPRRLYVQAPTNGSTLGRRSFDFDYIFPPWKKQRDVYDKCVQALIHHVLQSQQQGQLQHATIVAYGQTGTGKTYTMGMLSDFTDDKEQGIIPRALSQVLDFAGNEEDKVVVTLSFLQIYLETIQDLLAVPGTTSSATQGNPWRKHNARRNNASSGDLPVRQSRDGAFYVADLSEYEISSIEDAHDLLELAMRNRVLAATTKNKTSSRSHTLLTISIMRRHRGATRSRYTSSEDEEDEDHDEGSDENDPSQASTISFVDLAGSERVDGALHFLRATRARQEQRIREAKFINRSLSALGGVIAALAQPKTAPTGSASAHVLARLRGTSQNPVRSDQEQPHIRFRDSQLTKLLQGRLLGGRGRLLLIATVDDQPKNLSETLSTLKFAAQCRRVELQPGSKLRGDKASRLRRQKSQLDQVFNDMKMMHENREAALHNEYQARIEALERELKDVRAEVQSPTSSPRQEVAPIHVASYTALCSLVDSVCGQTREGKHPNVADFSTEKDMLEYIAGLYSRLKNALAAQQQHTEEGQNATVGIDDSGSNVPTIATNKQDNRQQLAEDKQSVSREPLYASQAINSTRKQEHHHIQLSAEQESEFRAVARHLITSRALDSFIVSSSDDDS